MDKVPSLEEIVATFSNRCREQNYTEEKLLDACAKCKMPSGAASFCVRHYIYAILTGEMKLTDSFKKEEPKPEPELPAWCKIGQWVTGYNGHTLANHDVMKIEEVYEDGNIKLVNNGWYVNVRHGDIAPVKFRPYTFEEAKSLLGKVMEWSYMSGTTCASLVFEVEENGAGVEINGIKFCNLQRWNATIDGIPIGVPIGVPEKAMEEDNND